MENQGASSAIAKFSVVYTIFLLIPQFPQNSSLNGDRKFQKISGLPNDGLNSI
jgi:hypothetical protein